MNYSPYIKNAPSSQKIMLTVILALTPGIIGLIFLQGSRWIGQLIFAAISALLIETIILIIRKKPIANAFDGSGLLTAFLLAISLPINTPIWLIVLSVSFAIFFGKMLYGGLGMNIFNPAMVGYVFAIISFPALISEHSAKMLNFIDIFNNVDVISSATPLDVLRNQKIPIHPDKHMILINILWMIGWLFLAIINYLDWRISISTIIGATITTMIFSTLKSNVYVFDQLIFGAVIFTATFIATDPVTAATSKKGRIIYGLLIGVLLILIRQLGNYPDGAAFAILLANALVPIIDQFTKPKYQ